MSRSIRGHSLASEFLLVVFSTLPATGAAFLGSRDVDKRLPTISPRASPVFSCLLEDPLKLSIHSRFFVNGEGSKHS